MRREQEEMKCNECLGEMIKDKLTDGIDTTYEFYLCSKCGKCDVPGCEIYHVEALEKWQK
jgi:hypothetical protein